MLLLHYRMQSEMWRGIWILPHRKNTPLTCCSSSFKSWDIPTYKARFQLLIITTVIFHRVVLVVVEFIQELGHNVVPCSSTRTTLFRTSVKTRKCSISPSNFLIKYLAIQNSLSQSHVKCRPIRAWTGREYGEPSGTVKAPLWMASMLSPNGSVEKHRR